MSRVLIAGGGWAGCAAALGVIRAGGEAVLIEKTDTLLGTGYVGGLMRNNGRFTAAEEMIVMGGGALFQLIDRTSLFATLPSTRDLTEEVNYGKAPSGDNLLSSVTVPSSCRLVGGRAVQHLRRQDRPSSREPRGRARRL